MPFKHNSIRDALYINLSDGRRLGFAEYGSEKGKPLLYFHGGLSCRLDIAFAADRLAEKGIRVIAPDRPGLGLSDPNPDRSLLNWAADVEELMEELGLREIPLLGWSLGSPYVLACAFALPQHFSKVAAIGSCATLDSPAAIAELGMFLDRFLLTCPTSFRWLAKSLLSVSSKAPAHMLKKLAESEVASSPADLEIVRMMPIRDLTDFIYGAMQQGPDGIIDDYWSVREPWGFAPSDIGIDMMLYQGEDDYVAPMSGATRLSEIVPGARLITIPKAGHFLLRTHFDQVIDSLFK